MNGIIRHSTNLAVGWWIGLPYGHRCRGERLNYMKAAPITPVLPGMFAIGFGY